MEKSLNVGTQSLLGYLPALLIKNILDEKINMKQKLPQFTTINTVSLFADISGFTKLSETFSKKGRIGPEFLAFSLNRYMEQLINIIGKNGGDIFKFAGDALFVVWPEEKENIARNCKRAIQCASDIQKNLHNAKICNGKAPLSIKIGIGVGEVKILIVGGFFGRCEYLAIGKAVREACQSESMASAGGETIMSQETYNIITNFVKVVELTPPANNHYKIDPKSRFYQITEIIGEKLNIKSETYLIRSRFAIDGLRKNVKNLKQFIPASITLYLDIEKEFWSKEIRMLSIMFLNLEFDMNKKEEEVNEMANLLITKVQRCVYRTRGGLNKFLMDDKGTLMLLCWGLPPMSNQDDHLRGVFSALSLMNDLKELDCNAYMSLTTGTCFTGVCGTLGNRREYSLLGEVVNLSARFMQEAIINGPKNGKKTLFLLDETTKKLIENKITCQYFNTFSPKGFSIQFKTFVPIIYEEKNLHKYFLKAYKFNPLPEIKTHKFNPILMGQIHKENIINEEHAAEALKDSLFIIDREAQLSKFVSLIQEAYKTKQKKLILIKGPTGSGKSLFLRRGFYELLNNDKNFYESIFKTETKRIFFCTYQTPITYKKPFNGFYKIFREIFQYLFLCFDEKANFKSFKLSKQSSNGKTESHRDQSSLNSKLKRFNEEIISIIIEERCFYLIKYLELILKKDLMGMFEKKYSKPTVKEDIDQTNLRNDKINHGDDSNYNSDNDKKQEEDEVNYAQDNLYTFNRTNSLDSIHNRNNYHENFDSEEIKNFNFELEKEHIIIPEQYDNYFAELKFANYLNSKYLNNFFLRLILLYQSTILYQDDRKDKAEQKDKNTAASELSRISTFNPNNHKNRYAMSKSKSIETGEHLFLVIEDCNFLDSFSIEFFKLLINDSRVKNISLIYTHQEQLFLHLEDKENKFARCPEFFNEETVEVFFMNNILNHEKVSKLIKLAILKSHLKYEKVAISKIESALIDIIISKSFKGNPFFIYEITESLLKSKKLIQHLSTEILVTTELLEMEKIKNWCEFKVPIVIEKLVGAIIDSLKLKDIITLKVASVIGNVFDIHSLMEINELSNVNNEEMYNILKSFEAIGILEFLWDKGPKQLICKFSLPFFREILYQRMLIEQKNELHLKAARTLQNPKFRYYSHETVVRLLNLHLRNSERTLLVQMEEDDSVEESYNKLYRNNMAGGNNLNKWAMRADDESETLNISNLKIYLVKDIVEKILNIEKHKNITNPKANYKNGKMLAGGDLPGKISIKGFGRSKSKGKSKDKEAKGTDESNVNKSLQRIISGIIDKKSDKNITWENRFCVATTNKFLYWYTQDQYFDNKVSLGSFFLSNILDVTILPDFHIGGRKNIISIYISGWFKKEESKGPRKFIFSFSTRKELYEWTMTLNFLRVKAIHDDFTLKFGIMHLPLKFEVKRKTVKIFKKVFTPDPNMIFEEPAFENNSVVKKDSDVVKIRRGSLEYQFAKNLLLRRTTGFSRFSNVNLNLEEFEKNQMIILKNTKNDLKELLEKGFLCFILCVQNLALNYEEDNNIFDNNLIKVPESFCNKVFKRNSANLSEQEINLNKNHKSSDASSFAVEDSLRNSFNSFNITNQELKVAKTPEKTNVISYNNISSFEDSNDKINEDKKIKELDLNNSANKSLIGYKQEFKNALKPSLLELSMTKEMKMQSELVKKRKQDEEKAKQDQLLREKISQILKKEIPLADKSDNNITNKNDKYEGILKNVQGSSFFDKMVGSVNGSESSKSPTKDFKRTNIRNDKKSPVSSYKEKILSSKSKERVNFKENASQEEKIMFDSSSFKNFTLNDIKSNHQSSGNIKEKEKAKENNTNNSNFDNNLKAEEVFVNYQYHDFLNKKFNKFSTSKNIEPNVKDNKIKSQNNSYQKLAENSFISEFSSNTDYYKLYNIKKSEDHDVLGNLNIFDTNSANNKNKKNNNTNVSNKMFDLNKKNKNQYNYVHELNQEDKLISKLKSFVIEMPNDDDIFNINQDFFEKKTTTSNGLDDKFNGGTDEDQIKKHTKRRSSLPNTKDLNDKQHENDSYYSKKIYKNHESNIFGMLKNI